MHKKPYPAPEIKPTGTPPAKVRVTVQGENRTHLRAYSGDRRTLTGAHRGASRSAKSKTL